VANKIIDKINEETAAEVAAIKSDALKKVELAASRIKNAAESKAKEIAAQAAVDADEVARRQVLIAELEARKAALGVKREVIEEAFSAAEEKLTQLPAAQWEKLVTRLILEGCVTGEETILVPAADREKYERGLLTKINAELKKSGKAGELKLSDEDGKFTGGVVLQGKLSEFDGSFATLLKIVRSEHEHDVASILFGPEVR